MYLQHLIGEETTAQAVKGQQNEHSQQTGSNYTIIIKVILHIKNVICR